MKKIIAIVALALVGCASVSLDELSAMTPAERNQVEPLSVGGSLQEVRQEAIACVNKHKADLGVETMGDVPKDYRDACWRIHHDLEERWLKKERERAQLEAMRKSCQVRKSVLLKNEWGRYVCVKSIEVEGW